MISHERQYLLNLSQYPEETTYKSNVKQIEMIDLCNSTVMALSLLQSRHLLYYLRLFPISSSFLNLILSFVFSFSHTISISTNNLKPHITPLLQGLSPLHNSPLYQLISGTKLSFYNDLALTQHP